MKTSSVVMRTSSQKRKVTKGTGFVRLNKRDIYLCLVGIAVTYVALYISLTGLNAIIGS